MAALSARWAEVDLPSFGRPSTTPEVPAARYAERLARLRERMAERGYDRLIVYADREHSANLAWLTGFDPRFEEAILVVGPDAEPLVLAGNECYGTAGAAPLPMRRELHQDLSLPSQPRDRSRPLRAVLADGGNIPLVAESVKVHSDASSAETWTGLLGPHDLGFIRPGDFEVIAIPKDNPANPSAGWYTTRTEYTAQLTKPLGCTGIVQPQ